MPAPSRCIACKTFCYVRDGPRVYCPTCHLWWNDAGSRVLDAFGVQA